MRTSIEATKIRISLPLRLPRGQSLSKPVLEFNTPFLWRAIEIIPRIQPAFFAPFQPVDIAVFEAQSVTIATLYPGSSECQSMDVFCKLGMGQYSKRGAVGDAKLPVNPVEVDLDGAFGESKPLRYFLVGQTFSHYPDDLAFTRGERFNSIRSCLRKFFQGLLHGMSFSTNSAGHSMFRGGGTCKKVV